MVDANEDQLRQVMANVTSNVHQHTPPGTAVEIQLRRQSANVVMTVTDDGPGVSAEHAARVFDRFWRADLPDVSELATQSFRR